MNMIIAALAALIFLGIVIGLFFLFRRFKHKLKIIPQGLRATPNVNDLEKNKGGGGAETERGMLEEVLSAQKIYVEKNDIKIDYEIK